MNSTILFAMLLSRPFGQGQEGGAAEMPDLPSSPSQKPLKGQPIILEAKANSMNDVALNDRQDVLGYLSRYDFDENHKLYPAEFAEYGNSIALGKQMDRFCDRFGDYYLNFSQGRVMRVEEDPETMLSPEQSGFGEQNHAEQYIDDVNEGAFWLLDAMSGMAVYSDLVDELSEEPMNSLTDALQVYKQAGGIYDFRIPLDGLRGYLAQHPDQAPKVLSDLISVDYTSYIGSEVPEDDQAAFAAFEAAVEDGRVANPLAFLGLYILAAAWENGLEDTFYSSPE